MGKVAPPGQTYASWRKSNRLLSVNLSALTPDTHDPYRDAPYPLALLVIVDNSPEAEDSVYIMHGGVQTGQDDAVWHGAEGRFFPLDPDWPSRLKPVVEGLREMFSKAPEFLTLMIRPRADADSEVVPLGWKLPT